MSDLELEIFPKSDFLCFKVKLQPRAHRDKVAGLYGEALKICLTSPPLEGRANRHLLQFLGKILNVSSAEISLMSGQKSRLKTVGIRGLDEDGLRHRLAPYIV